MRRSWSNSKENNHWISLLNGGDVKNNIALRLVRPTNVLNRPHASAN